VPISAPTVRLAAEPDIPVLAAMLARSFADDPVSMWTCPAEAMLPETLRRFFETRLRLLIDEGSVWTTPELSAAAIWAPPHRAHSTPAEDFALTRPLLRRAILGHPTTLARVPMVGLALAGIQRRHPHDPAHWYLAVLGTEPLLQGRGLGSAVLTPVLQACDADEVGAYLESSKERNIDFYVRHGFRVTREDRLPRGPKVWAMWRDPGG
jgi:ribosomal protein S18 acetylase RimI-like enzyme